MHLHENEACGEQQQGCTDGIWTGEVADTICLVSLEAEAEADEAPSDIEMHCLVF